MTLALAALFIGSAATFVAASPAYAIAECPKNFSCYYSDDASNSLLWIAPHCGPYDVSELHLTGPIKSIINNGHGTVTLYDSNHQPYQKIPVGTAASATPEPPTSIDIACG